ncbi:unnamed protein product, partial [Heterosigma akashiwo]
PARFREPGAFVPPRGPRGPAQLAGVLRARGAQPDDQGPPARVLRRGGAVKPGGEAARAGAQGSPGGARGPGGRDRGAGAEERGDGEG